MKIALTKKLSEAVGVKAAFAQENENPLFSWTANWTKVWDNRRTEDMIVLVNNATRFTVAIYQVKKKDLKNLEEMMKKAISNTLLFMNINPEIVEEYMRLAGDVELAQNRGRQTAAWVSKAGLECSFYVGREYNGIEKMFCDTVGSLINYHHVNITKTRDEGFVPYREMINALTELTGKPAYKYRAFELSATLDLDVYKAVRRIIVPANLSFERLHIIRPFQSAPFLSAQIVALQRRNGMTSVKKKSISTSFGSNGMPACISSRNSLFKLGMRPNGVRRKSISTPFATKPALGSMIVGFAFVLSGKQMN